MKVNINLSSRGSILKKLITGIIIIIVFTFLKENVFALSVPEIVAPYIFDSYHEGSSYSCSHLYDNGYIQTCFDEDDYEMMGDIFNLQRLKYFIYVYNFNEYANNGQGAPGSMLIYAFEEKPLLSCYTYHSINFDDMPLVNCDFKNYQRQDIYAWIFNGYLGGSDYPSSWQGQLTHTINYSWLPIEFDLSIGYGQLDKLDRFETNFDLTYLSGDTVFYANNTNMWSEKIERWDGGDDRNIFEKIWDAITSIPSNIYKFFKNLFIPDTDMMLDTLSSQYEYMEDRLGFLMYPIDVLSDFITRFSNLSNSTSAIFYIPTVSFMGSNIINSTSFDLMTVVNSSTAFTYLYQVYRIIVPAIIVFALVNLGMSKFNETFGGDKE